MSYHQFKNELGKEYGCFEVFEGDVYGYGWYWWACFPGCLPDSECFGPFATEQEAIDDGQKEA